MGSGGGGSSSGTIGYPDHMEALHRNWLKGVGPAEDKFLANDMLAVTDAAHAANPYTNETSYDPDSDSFLTSMESAVAIFSSLVGATDPLVNWTNAMTIARSNFDSTVNVVDPAADVEIAASVEAFETLVDDRVTNDSLPRFQHGMLSVNSVNTSAFIMGQADIEAKASHEVDDYQGKLRVEAYLQRDKILANVEVSRRMAIGQASDTVFGGFFQRLELDKNVMHYEIEKDRISMIAKTEENTENISLAVQDATWDLDVLMYPFNAIGSIGASSHPPKRHDTRGQSALSGGLTGAATGAMLGAAKGSAASWWGAGIGAIVGGIGGYLAG